jgi:hypothetical protein
MQFKKYGNQKTLRIFSNTVSDKNTAKKKPYEISATQVLIHHSSGLIGMYFLSQAREAVPFSLAK